MSYSVIGLNKDQVISGYISYVLKLFSNAIHEINSQIAESQTVTGLEEIIILSTKYSKYHPEQLIRKFGNYEMFLFLNPLGKNIADKYHMDFNFVGSIDDPPLETILLMRNYLIGKYSF